MVLINKSVIKRFFLMFAAICTMGFALSFLINVNWGLDPSSFCNKSVSKYIGLMLGTWQFCCYVAMFVIVLILNRKLIGAGTIVSLFIGYIADFFCFVWERTIPAQVFTQPQYTALKVVIFILAIATFVIFAAVYMNADMGLCPYDALPIIISSHIPKVPFTVVRIAFDITVVSIGIVFCAKKNPYLLRSLPGALIMSFSLGPAITFVGKRMKHFITKT